MPRAIRHPFPRRSDGRPLAIGHRGASAHAPENTLVAFRMAAQLGADMVELDVRLTADGVPVVSHDTSTARVHGIDVIVSQVTADALREFVPALPTLAETIALAEAIGIGLYVEIKAPGAGRAALDLLERSGFAPAALGSFDSAEVADMAEAGSAWPLSVLVRTGEDPIARAAEAKADIAHLCWENASDRPQDLITPRLLEQLQKAGLGLVLWHEERPQVLEDLIVLPALGICTDKPELLGGFHAGLVPGMEIVCHRGINHIAPENTRAAALLAYDFGADWLELDVRETADHEIVVLHDPTLDRTTNGHGLVGEHSLAQLRALDAGSWKAPRYSGERLQTLGEAIALCQERGRCMYIENKAVDPARLLAEVNAHGFLDDCFFWSPDMHLLREIRRLSPAARIKSNISHHGGFKAMQRELAPQICEIQVDDWETEAPMCREHGITPMLIYFGDDPEIFSRIAAWRPEMVNLDRADKMLAAVRRYGVFR